MVKVTSCSDINKATGSKAKASFLKDKACQLNPKDRPSPRPCSPKARARPNTFSVKHKKILRKSDTDKRKQYTLTIVFIMSYRYCCFRNLSLQFVIFQKHQHWPRPRLTRPRSRLWPIRPRPRTNILTSCGRYRIGRFWLFLLCAPRTADGRSRFAWHVYCILVRAGGGILSVRRSDVRHYDRVRHHVSVLHVRHSASDRWRWPVTDSSSPCLSAELRFREAPPARRGISDSGFVMPGNSQFQFHSFACGSSK